MTTYSTLKNTAMVLAVAATALATAGIANADDYGRNGDRDHGNAAVTIGFGNVAFGFRDGYWDNDHRWHHWRHSHDYRSYRDQDGSHYYNGYHRHYDNNGWQQQN